MSVVAKEAADFARSHTPSMRQLIVTLAGMGRELEWSTFVRLDEPKLRDWIHAIEPLPKPVGRAQLVDALAQEDLLPALAARIDRDEPPTTLDLVACAEYATRVLPLFSWIRVRHRRRCFGSSSPHIKTPPGDMQGFRFLSFSTEGC